MNPINDPIYLQRQIRHNNDDLMDFCADLKRWGDDMNKKDQSIIEENNSKDVHVPLVRNKVRKKSDLNASKPKKTENLKTSKKLNSFDYSAWDKFDVDAECAKIDEQKSDNDEDSGELTDECDETVREEAIYHKDKGNKFVKKEGWNQAIECYTKAIDCYAYDPVFYANRALCHLKNLDYRLAESDCTTAIQLDKTYVKAYHRRAMAREALNQLNEAHDDLLKIFDYEPDNKESKNALAKLEKKLESLAKQSCTKVVEQRPKSKFTLSRQQQQSLPDQTCQISKPTVEQPASLKNESINKTYWPSGNTIQLIRPIINKVPHLRSRAPLRRINVLDSDSITIPQQVQSIAQPLPLPNSDSSVIKCDDFTVIERKSEQYEKMEEDAVTSNKYTNATVSEKQNKNDTFYFAVPDTSVQFNYDWRLIKNNSEWKYLYLKQVQPKKLQKIFKDSLECDIFSGIINTLSEMFIVKNISVYEYLYELTEVKRFHMLAMFMSDNDKQDLWKLVDYLRSDKNIPGEDIDNIIHKYSLQP